MAMTIDEAIKRYKNNAEYERTHGNLQGCLEFRQLAKWLEQYQLIQADYNARLKADMVAMLTEIQLEIEDLYPEHQCTGELTGFADAIETITPIIQQKIDKLREQQ